MSKSKRAQLNFKKVLINIGVYGGTTLEIFFAYFMYVAIMESYTSTAAAFNYNSDALEKSFIAVAIVLAVANLIEDVLSVNPAEEVYAISNPEADATEENQEQLSLSNTLNFIVDKPLKFLSVLLAYASFITLSAADSIPVVVFISNDYLKWFLSCIPILLGTIYYHMLAYRDAVEHHTFIYRRLFSADTSVLLGMIKNPLLSLEVLINVGANVILRTGLYSYALVYLFEKEGFVKQIDPSLYKYFILATFFTMGYSTFFSRLISTYKEYFPAETILNHSCSAALSKKFAFNCFLRALRAGGFSYLLFKNLPLSEPTHYLVAGSVGFALLAHGIYVSYRQELNSLARKITEPARDYVPSKASAIFVNAVNITAKIAFTLALMGAFLDIIDRLQSNHIISKVEFDEVIALVTSLAIPVSLNNFDYYSKKLNDTVHYYIDKYQKESRTQRFGKFCFLFRSVKEYQVPTTLKEVAVNETSPLLL